MTTSGAGGAAAGRVASAAVAALLAGLAALVGLPLVVLAAAAAAPLPPGCGPAGTAQTVDGVTLDAEQLGHAATIVDVTAARALPAYAATIALAVVAQESMFHNFTVAVDHDSLGLYQQRERYYGRDVATNPARATAAFLDRLVAQPAWQTRPLTDVAADIQRPREDLRGRYAHWQPLAQHLTDLLWPGAAAGVPGVPCPDTVTEPAPAGAGTPHGLVLDGTPAGNTAAGYAIAQVGKPYAWGAEGPDSYDCSGLTMAAWAAAGTAIARTTYGQVTTGVPITLDQVRSGDLVLIPGTHGTPTAPGHVGIIAGHTPDRTVWIIHAPQPGTTIRYTTTTAWAGDITAIRRVG